MREKIFTPKKKRNFRKEALARLKMYWQKEHEDETWEADKEPVITHLLNSVEGGIPLIIESLRAHDDSEAQTFIESYDSIPKSDRKILPIESIAFASGIGSLRLAELAQTALFLYASMQTKLLISSSMVKVTRSIVKAATDEMPITARDAQTGDNVVVGHTNGDVKAMHLFGTIAGIVPVPKGNITAIQNIYGDREAEKPVITVPAWKTPEERLREIQDMTEPKRLPSPAVQPISIGGHIDHMQAETVEILRGE